MRAISWNLSHGRDHPPDPTLFTWRSRLFRVREENGTHVQANRSLRAEFATVLARDDWDVALLQEVPPRWLAALCRRARACGALVLTARNLGAAPRAWLADHNPDLIASNEGGSNQLLARPPWRLAEVRRMTLTSRPERRRMLWARLERPDGARLVAATLHASAHVEAHAARDTELAADRAVEWAGDDPLLFGGDLNLRPRSSAATFDRLAERFELAPPTAPRAVDHLFVRRLARRAPALLLAPAWRELTASDGQALRLSDHDAVALDFASPA